MKLLNVVSIDIDEGIGDLLNEVSCRFPKFGFYKKFEILMLLLFRYYRRKNIESWFDLVTLRVDSYTICFIRFYRFFKCGFRLIRSSEPSATNF